MLCKKKMNVKNLKGFINKTPKNVSCDTMSKMAIEQVTDIAIDYAKKAGYPWIKILSVKFDALSNSWGVSIDVGTINQNIKIVKVDDGNGRVVGFE